MFRRLLIANRGEIARRIVRGCRAAGVAPYVVYSEADAEGSWVREADGGLCIGPARSDRSYLNSDAILQAAEQLDCQALHPGYGFLSENATFAARCEQQGLTFVGPTPQSIRSMGDKITAKRTIAATGLPTIPGSDGGVRDVEHARELADIAGYPVLLKATAGGGGRGMRRCDSPNELEAAFRDARLEAESSFGNPELYLEKFLDGGRHIEFQVLCDAFGQGVHLGERDCSIQRRHQKLIEESPSPAIDAAKRAAFGQQVAEAVAKLGYRNAGTVEFLMSAEGELYFMEMNTRLQVEHPVTEEVTGVDLVEEQLYIAANHPLRLSAAPELNGHSIEFRINAEDPTQDFRPDPGVVSTLEIPSCDPSEGRIRWESALESGSRIPPYYDSMVGKLIVHAKDRTAACALAARALEGLNILGVKTTIPLHKKILAHPQFQSGDFDIRFLSQSGILEQ